MNRKLLLGLIAGLVALVAANGRPPAQPSQPGSATPAWLSPIPIRTTYSTQCYYPRSEPVVDRRPLVWVLDGAGDLKGCSNAVAYANTLAGDPIELCVFPWSHGYRQLLKDQVDITHARVQGAKLAAAIRERQALEPGRRVVIVAHSAGCAVALTATECLPPDSIDRLILLAPSVSTGYNIRPALWSAREGVDVFCSRKDWVALGFVTRVVGTTDRVWAKAAGRHGFRPACLDQLEITRLRQHFWTPDLTWTGHTGGHYGTHSPAFLHAYVFPLIGVTIR